MSAPSNAGWKVTQAALAVGACAHLLGNTRIGQPAAQLGVAIAAAWALSAPGNPRRLIPLVATGWWLTWTETPTLGNHQLLWVLATTSVTAAGLIAGNDPARAWPIARSALQVLLLGSYGFAALAKLNPDFINPATSCAAQLYTGTLQSLGLDGVAQWQPALTAAGTLTAIGELAVFTLLLLRRTRTFGIGFACLFHLALAAGLTHQFYDFTTVLLPLFWAFGPEQAHEALLERFRKLPHRHAITTTAALGTGLLTLAPHPAGHLLGWITFWVVAPVTCTIAVRAAIGHTTHPARWRHPLAAGLLLVTVANGLSPYLEIKTATSWNMYSNLLTANGHSNHYLISRTIPVRHPFRDAVTIQANSEPAVGLLRGQEVPRENLARWGKENPEQTVTYQTADGTTIGPVRGQDLDLGPDGSTLTQRLLVTRAANLDGPQHCQERWTGAR